jgi:hypothetical protein
MFTDAKKELAKLRRQRTLGYCTPFGRIAELERFIATNGKSHGVSPLQVQLSYAEHAANDKFLSPSVEAKLEWIRMADRIRAEIQKENAK